MKSVIILAAGQFGKTASCLLNTAHLALLAFGDNSPACQNTSFSHPFLGQVPILPVKEALALKPDYALIGVTDEKRTCQLRLQAMECGFQGEFLLLSDLYRQLDIRTAVVCRLAERIRQGCDGAIAELGVYKGDLAWKLNALFPDRPLYLFDTFEGFCQKDVSAEEALHVSHAKKGDFSDTSMDTVLSRLPFPEKAIVKKGYFPDSTHGMSQERFAFVSLDADLYLPILTGLTYFYPRLNRGGMILLHDYNNARFQGAKEAVKKYEAAHGSIPLVPLCDLHGSAVIIKPF